MASSGIGSCWVKLPVNLSCMSSPLMPRAPEAHRRSAAARHSGRASASGCNRATPRPSGPKVTSTAGTPAARAVCGRYRYRPPRARGPYRRPAAAPPHAGARGRACAPAAYRPRPASRNSPRTPSRVIRVSASPSGLLVQIPTRVARRQQPLHRRHRAGIQPRLAVDDILVIGPAAGGYCASTSASVQAPAAPAPARAAASPARRETPSAHRARVTAPRPGPSGETGIRRRDQIGRGIRQRAVQIEDHRAHAGPPLQQSAEQLQSVIAREPLR